MEEKKDKATKMSDAVGQRSQRTEKQIRCPSKTEHKIQNTGMRKLGLWPIREPTKAIKRT